jgi:CelD/BcsL family acetyltransferase involved in cellulose biosynthesis
VKIAVVESVEEMGRLQPAWQELSGATCSSLFSSYDYVSLAWQHFRRPGDRLFVLVLSDGPEVAAIVPLCRRLRRSHGIPLREIRFIAEWEGDRPGFVSRRPGEATWREVSAFLREQRRDWDVVQLVEQPAEGPQGSGWACLEGPGVAWEREDDAVDYYVPVAGSWDDFLGRLSSRTRHEFRRQSRRLAALPGGFAVERVVEPARSREVVERFVALERTGWKADASVGVGKDERHEAFYRELLALLAAKGQAATFFLTSGGQDLAGAMLFLHGKVVYYRHVTYSSAFSGYSPGVLVGAEVFRFGFDGGYDEVDMLGLRSEDGASHRHKTHWASGQRPTVRLTGYRKRGRLLPIFVARRLRSLVKGARPAGSASKLEVRFIPARHSIRSQSSCQSRRQPLSQGPSSASAAPVQWSPSRM